MTASGPAAVRDLVCKPEGMDGRRRVRGERGAEELPRESAGAAHRLLPGRAVGPAPSLGRARQRTEGLTAVGEDAEIDVAVAPDLLARDVHLDDARRAGDEARLAAAGEEPEARAEQEHRIRAVAGLPEHGERPEAAARERVVAGHDPQRLRVGDHRDTRQLGEGP